jgi:hypothetical protein
MKTRQHDRQIRTRRRHRDYHIERALISAISGREVHRRRPCRDFANGDFSGQASCYTHAETPDAPLEMPAC